MSPFRTLYTRGRDGGVHTRAHAAFFGSAAFVDRLEFEGVQGARDKVAALLYMLQHVALDPREVGGLMKQMSGGWIYLRFFGWSNPVGGVDVEPGEDLERIKAAVQANLAGPLHSAAKRVMKWRQPKINARRGRHEDAVMSRLRESLQWPARKDGQADSQWKLNYEQLDEKLRKLRDRRNGRLAMLARAAGPKQGGWTEFLEAMALEVLQEKAAH